MKTSFFSEYKNVESEFFEINEERNLAYVRLQFGSPQEIFDKNYRSKLPVLSDDFLDWVLSAFRLIPKKYKISLDVRFDDLAGYDEAELSEIFKKNLFLEFKTEQSQKKKDARIAYGLLGLGTAFFVAMLLIQRLWVSDSVLKDIFFYVSDILTTVTFWEAMTLLVVKRAETDGALRDLATRFFAISFRKAEQPDA